MRTEKEYQTNDEVHVRFDMGRRFSRAYYRDEMKAKNLNPDYHLSINVTTQKEIQNIILMKVKNL